MNVTRRQFLASSAIVGLGGAASAETMTSSAATATAEDAAASWTIYVTNDNCPDYTWGFDEKTTRQAYADIVRAHLDLMNRTDADAPENRDCYNMAVTNEALCFIKSNPDRTDELAGRIREGRITLSPFLCNSLWGLQSVEGFLRTLYPARWLEQELKIPIDVAEHIELPSLPWGAASLLAGCGIRWLVVPFYDYDSTFAGLKCPPLFQYEGPDGGQLRVVLDSWASHRGSYMQGAKLLKNPDVEVPEWIKHYESLGASYPARAILASGTHGDISPRSGDQAEGFARSIRDYNAGHPDGSKIINATLGQFCKAIDDVESKTPFLPVVRGDLGISWEAWPVCLSKYVAGYREAERLQLAAETLTAVKLRLMRDPFWATAPHYHYLGDPVGFGPMFNNVAGKREVHIWPDANDPWFRWIMLSDHAWNGTDDVNRKENARLRRAWSEKLYEDATDRRTGFWPPVGVRPDRLAVAAFNSLSIPRRDLVRVEDAGEDEALANDGQPLESQHVKEESKAVLYAVSPEIASFGFHALRIDKPSEAAKPASRLRASRTELVGPFYQLRIDRAAGGIVSLIHVPSGKELIADGSVLGRTTVRDMSDLDVSLTDCTVVAEGPVLARLRMHHHAGKYDAQTEVTLYADLDRVDFDIRFMRLWQLDEPDLQGPKPLGNLLPERVCHIFPILRPGGHLLIETLGALIRPEPQPEGDLLPGADPRRFAVQGFVAARSADAPTVVIAPREAFLLRRDLGHVTFEALGFDQNPKEVTHDQDRDNLHRFRYSLRAFAPTEPPASWIAWSRQAATALLIKRGVDLKALTETSFGPRPLPSLSAGITIDPRRAIATSLRSALFAEAALALRIQEIAGQSGPIEIGVKNFTGAILTDLLERDRGELPIQDGKIRVDLAAHGFAAVRLSGAVRTDAPATKNR